MSKKGLLNIALGVLFLEGLVRFIPSFMVVGLMIFFSTMKIHNKDSKKEIA